MFDRVRPKLSYANVMVTVLAFIVLGGGAYASSQLKPNSVGTAQIRANAVIGSKVKSGTLSGSDIKASSLPTVPSAHTAAQATNADHAVSSDHSISSDNAANSDQLDGRTSSEYGAVLSGRINTLATTFNAFDYGSASGISTANSTESAVSTLSPNHDLTARDLSVEVTATPGSCGFVDCGRTFNLVVNGTNGSLSCTIRGSLSETTCNSGAESALIPANSTLSIGDYVASLPSAAAANARFALRLTP